MILIDNLSLNYIIRVPLFFSTCPMSGDISTQSPNLDKNHLKKRRRRRRRSRSYEVEVSLNLD